MDSLRGDFPRAFENLKYYGAYKDSLLNETKDRNIKLAENKFKAAAFQNEVRLPA